jgi:hypothetical protein
MQSINWNKVQVLALPPEKRCQSYAPDVSGFVIGRVDGVGDPKKRQLAWAQGACGPVVMWTTGGNFLYDYTTKNQQPNTRYWANVGHTFTLPVPARSQFSIMWYFASHNDSKPWVCFYWVPKECADVVPVDEAIPSLANAVGEANE